MSARKEAKTIMIKCTPSGEAPEEVRRYWVGLLLTCIPGEPGPQPVIGALTGEVLGTTEGFNVLQEHALEVLGEHHPKAAAWWHRWGFPDKTLPCFRFRAEECEVIDYYTDEELAAMPRGRIQVWDDLDRMWMP